VEWLLEATAATYLPLIRAGRRLRARGIGGGLTISISPILAEQLAHPSFREELRRWIDARIATSAEEAERFDASGDAAKAALARRWEGAYRAERAFFFDALREDILGAFADLARTGTIELATCGATHGYFPLLARDETIALQTRLAKRTHELRFGSPPAGMWLPEAAYRPAGWWRSPTSETPVLRTGIEEFLGRDSIRYFLVDSALVTGGRAIGSSLDPTSQSHVAPNAAPERLAHPLDTREPFWVARECGAAPEVAAFARDPATAEQVWSKDRGYPGDPAYLEFHKKSDGGGHRYWRVTGPGVDLGDKAPYDPEQASARVREHARHFVELVRAALAGAPGDRILVAPFDAELFGHWWFEGVDWLEQVIERLAAEPSVRLDSLADHLERHPPRTVVRLPEGSWGEGGHHDVWQNPKVAWTWTLIHRAEHEVWALVERARRVSSEEGQRIAAAALRQLLLLVASDWQFLITTGSAAEYATARVEQHAEAAFALAEMGRRVLAGAALDDAERAFVEELEERDDPFPHLAEVVSLCGPLREIAATGSPGARSFRREALEGRSRRGRPATP
jgi:1,4-alpha-glucan branching enzyme